MAFADDILTILFNYSAGYKLMRQSLRGTNRFSASAKSSQRLKSNQTFYLTLSRLKKRGLVTKNNEVWKITDKGKEYFREKLARFLPQHRKTTVSSLSRKNMIIAFDIPEKYRRKRDWLRIELSLLKFSPIQKSVWFGPAPIPKDFIENLHMLKILEYLKFFEVKEKDII